MGIPEQNGELENKVIAEAQRRLNILASRVPDCVSRLIGCLETLDIDRSNIESAKVAQNSSTSAFEAKDNLTQVLADLIIAMVALKNAAESNYHPMFRSQAENIMGHLYKGATISCKGLLTFNAAQREIKCTHPISDRCVHMLSPS